MASSTTSESPAPPAAGLLALPLELKYQILTHLFDNDGSAPLDLYTSNDIPHRFAIVLAHPRLAQDLKRFWRPTILCLHRADQLRSLSSKPDPSLTSLQSRNSI